LKNEGRYRTRQKRDIRVEAHLDAQRAEQRYALEFALHASEQRMFDRSMTLSFIDSLLGTMRSEYRGNKEQFDALVPFLTQSHAHDGAYELIAKQYGLSIAAVKQRVHRLRKKFRALIRKHCDDEQLEALLKSLDVEQPT
jgi:hypothetical protein